MASLVSNLAGKHVDIDDNFLRAELSLFIGVSGQVEYFLMDILHFTQNLSKKITGSYITAIGFSNYRETSVSVIVFFILDN